MNIAYADVARLIWESAGGWHYDDSNATTLPIAKTTLVHNQQDYTLPTDAQRVHRVEVKDSNGEWIKLKYIDEADITGTLPEFLGGNTGTPVYYHLEGRSCLLYPTPSSASVTTASGLAFYVDRDVTDFAVTAASTSPGFAAPFHRILSYAAAIDFIQDPKAKEELIIQKARLEKGLTRFYSKRAPESKTTIKPAGKKRWSQYL
jgi:voltage-gated potassium channel Kch